MRNQRIFLNRLIAQPDLKKEFGAELKRRRMKSGISQERLAEMADLHRTYISAVESGKRNLTLESIQRLAQALGATVGSFFMSVEQGPEQAGSRRETPGSNGQGRNAAPILIVEDDPRDIEFTLAAFKAAKVANPVLVARDGPAGLDLLEQNVQTLPQLVLLDLQLPKLHGLEVLRRIRADHRFKQIPIVVLTASRSDRDVQEAMRLGANAFLSKPVDFHRFADITPKLSLHWALF
jgi:CheY-like chemotaxis protein/DNA-binding XRE family transcriptional regulator